VVNKKLSLKEAKKFCIEETKIDRILKEIQSGKKIRRKKK